jgi:hypothetical protein
MDIKNSSAWDNVGCDTATVCDSETLQHPMTATLCSTAQDWHAQIKQILFMFI